MVSLLVLAAALVALVAGCGGSSSDTSGTETTETQSTEAGSESGDAAAAVAKAKEEVVKLEDVNGLEYPEPPKKPFDPGDHKAAIITCGLDGGCKLGAEWVKEALETAGWTTGPIGDAKYEPTVAAGLIQTAVQEGVSAIILANIEASTVAAAIDAAADADIPVVCIACVSGPEWTESGKVIDLEWPARADGEALAYYILANRSEDGKIIAFNDSSGAINRDRYEGFKGVITSLCPECELEAQNLKTTEVQEAGPPLFTAALAKNPSGGDFEWGYFSSAVWANNAAKTAIAAGRNEIRFAGGEAEPEYLEVMNAGEVDAVGTWQPNIYGCWAAVDLAIRSANGMPTWSTDDLPVALITKKNIAPFLAASPGIYEPPGFDFKQMFKEVWSG